MPQWFILLMALYQWLSDLDFDWDWSWDIDWNWDFPKWFF